MRKIPIKAVSAVMACSLMIPFVACSKANESGADMTEGTSGEVRSGNAISDGKVWFNCKQIKVANYDDPNKEIVDSEHKILGTDEKYLVVYTKGSCREKEGTVPDELNTSILFDRVDVFDIKSGEPVSRIDLREGEPIGFMTEDVKYSNGVITTRCSGSVNGDHQERDYDPQTGMRSAARQIQETEDQNNNVYKVNGYSISADTDYNSKPSKINLNIKSKDGASSKVELKDTELNLFFASSFLQYDGNKVIVPVLTDGECAIFEVDLAAGTANRMDSKDYEWLDANRITNTYNSNDGYTYFVDKAGVTKIDFANKKKEIVFDYSNCGEDRYSLVNKEIVYTNQDCYILAGNEPKPALAGRRTEKEYTIDIFTKTDNNPNAGKTILELYYGSEYLDSTTSKAIKMFNETNSEYYIEVSDRYVKSSGNGDIQSEDDEESLILANSADMGSKLTVDIINGEGPDILMNTADMNQLNNSNYLADLSGYVANLAPEQYYTNIIEASKDGGKLYQIPITYRIEGIQTFDKYAGKSGVGFTFDEYEKFVDETLNGTDIIDYGQSIYFTYLFASMKEKFIVDGHVDLSAPEFEKMAKYVKDYVPENGVTWQDKSGVGAVGASLHKFDKYGPQPAYFASCDGYSRYLTVVDMSGGATRLLGFPSADGRGPMVGMQTSIAVSAQSESVDACGEFVKILLSEEIQEGYAMDNMFVLNRDILKKVGQTAIKSFFEYTSYETTPTNTSVSEQSIVELDKNIAGCSCTKSVDAEIAIILKEEMAPYFIDQKQLPEVVAIAQDRVQKVLDERG